MGNMRFKVGDHVRIKSLDWYNENKKKELRSCIECGNMMFTPQMSKWCGKIVTIIRIENNCYTDENARYWTDEMIEGLAEEETKPKFKIGDRVIARDMSGIWEITNVEDDILYTIKRENHTFTLTTYGSFLTLYEGISDKKEEMKSEDGLLDEYEELTGRAFKGGYEKCKSDIELNGFQLPEGYIFKDENGNVINATKIVLEKKKKEYPKTYEECCEVLWINSENFLSIRNVHRYDGEEETIKYERDLLDKFDYLWQLIICRDAYWKIAGEEMGLGKSWEPDWNTSEPKYVIAYTSRGIEKQWETTYCKGFAFPTEEMRDAFYENFKELIEMCKELL